MTETYAVTGESYIYDQARFALSTDSLILAERRAPNDLEPFRPFKCLRRQSASGLVERIRDRLARSPFGYLSLLGWDRFLSENIRDHRADLIHAHFGMTGFRCLRARKELGIPLVVTFYGVDVSHCVRSPYWIPRFRRMFDEGERFIVLCQEAADRLAAIGCDPSLIRLWDIGIPLEEYPYRPPRPRADASFLTVARFVEKKGYPILIQAFARVASRHRDVTLTIMGHGPLKATIQALIASARLEDRIRLVDTTEMPDFFGEFRHALRTHDAFVLPSIVASDGDDEGGPPVVIANAMAVGLPVISTPVGGITRAIEHGRSGLLAESGNSEDLAVMMERLIASPQIWADLSAKGREKIERQFELRAQIAKLEAIYSEVCG